MINIGIDLGTTNSLVGAYIDGKVQLIPNQHNDIMTPSVVGLGDSGEVIVGAAAKERLTTHPDKTAAVFKPFMGSGKTYSLANKTFSVEELSALILKSLKEDAEAFLGEQQIGNIVISVPAYFNNSQRNSVKNAARIAGLKVEKVVSEPTAAALCYGMNQPDFEATFIVLDLGGGTFDVSLMEQFDGIFDIRGSAGDNRLGGEDFLDTLVTEFLKFHQLDAHSLTANELARIRSQCENLKRNLTATNDAQAPVNIKENVYSFKMSNDVFKEIARPLLDRFKQPIIRVLKDTNTAIRNIDHVVLVGGASRMTIFQTLIKEFFPSSNIINHDPDEAVVKGAVIQSELDGRDGAVQEYVVTDVTPYTLGIDVFNTDFDKNVYLPIIERNSPIPISKAVKVTKRSSGQTGMKVDVYQGESLDAKKNLKLGTVEINTPWADPDTEVSVQLTYDFNGMIDILVPDANIREKAIIQNSQTILSEEAIIAQAKRIEALRILPRDKSANKLLIAKLERLYEETLGAERKKIMSLLQQFYVALDSDEPMQIHKVAKMVSQYLSKFEFKAAE